MWRKNTVHKLFRVLTRNSRSKKSQMRVCSAWILELSRLSLFHRIFSLSLSLFRSLTLSHRCTWTHFYLIPFLLLLAVYLPPNVSSITGEREKVCESDVAFNYSLTDSLNFLEKGVCHALHLFLSFVYLQMSVSVILHLNTSWRERERQHKHSHKSLVSAL